MRLGSSIRRRRKEGRSRRSARKESGEAGGSSRGGGRRTLLLAVGLALGGFGGGWLLATRVIFPGPPPPGDLYAVPDVYGLPADEAGDRLETAGLALGDVDPLRHPTLDSGVVVGQSPLPGQLARPDEPVRLSLSLGPERRPVPLVGRIRPERARAVLEAAGFGVTVDSVESSQPRGRIVAIEPPPGTTVALPGNVRLTVSLGPPTVTMPLLLGMTERQARDTLRATGLVVSRVEEVFLFGARQGEVVEQEPPAETVVQAGSAVRFVVGRRSREADTTAVDGSGPDPPSSPRNKGPSRK